MMNALDFQTLATWTFKASDKSGMIEKSLPPGA